MWIRGGGKTLIHKMWIKNMFLFLNPSLIGLQQNCGNCILPTKLGSVEKKQKVYLIFYQSSPYSDSLGQIWVVRSYLNMEMIEKLEALSGFLQH